MASLGDYIAGRGDAPSRRELNRLVERYEWFTTARRARALITGEADPALVLPLTFRATVPPTASRKLPKAVLSPDADLIDRFIRHGGYRIVPSGENAEVRVDVDIDPEMVTEELAEIYRAQGLTGEAEKIYRILKRR